MAHHRPGLFYITLQILYSVYCELGPHSCEKQKVHILTPEIKVRTIQKISENNYITAAPSKIKTYRSVARYTSSTIAKLRTFWQSPRANTIQAFSSMLTDLIYSGLDKLPAGNTWISHIGTGVTESQHNYNCLLISARKNRLRDNFVPLFIIKR